MRLLIALVLAFMGCNTPTTDKASITPIKLICEYAKNPSVINTDEPYLGWVNTPLTKMNGLKQTAYQIRVSPSKEKLNEAELWDTGKVLSDSSILINYKGKKLASRQECWWQVRVWDQNDNVSEWSEPNTWRVGLLHSQDWKAEWIGVPWQGEKPFPKPDGGPDGRPKDFGPPAPLLRKEFNIEKEIEKAVAFVTGLGYFEFYANGKKVGDDLLVPNQTNYGKRPNLANSLINVEDNFKDYSVMYLAYDLKEYLQKGKNSIGSILGNGFYNPAKFWAEGYGTPRFLGQIHITYKDGTEEVITSDASWKCSKGPILMNMVYYGEQYDARKEQKGWSSAEFDDKDWESVSLKKAPEGKLVAHTSHTDKVTQRLKPVSITKKENGNYLVDFGVEISGWVRLNNVEAPQGHKIEITFNGNLYSGDNSYIFKGEGPESYAPRFNWFVFSGIEIKNWHGELKPEHLIAEAVNTHIEESAKFETSNELFNKIQTIWRRSQLGNMHGGIVSDCPHRERSAYTGDGQVACATVMHNYDSKNFYHKWLQDIFDSQNRETGYVPNGAPWQPGCGGGIAWGAAISIIPWEFYLQYNDLRILEQAYDGMKGYIDYMETWRRSDGIVHSLRKGADGSVVKWFNLGEWASASPLPPNELVHTFYFWRCSEIAYQTARILGRNDEADKYQRLANSVKKAFHATFYDAEKESYGNGGANILALRMGVPKDIRPKVLKALKANIKANDGHLDTGIFGTRFFFEVLAGHGLNDFAYGAMNKKDEPSFGHWVKLGSTTTREHWDDSGSHNHPMFGGGLVWFYRNLAGMQTDPSNPGYKHIIFKPQPLDSLDFVTYSNETVYGKAGIHWENGKDSFAMDITVPVGSTAEVHVPHKNPDNIFIDGKKAVLNEFVSFMKSEDEYSIFTVSSGHYPFKVVE